jgi:hypothetical protein
LSNFPSNNVIHLGSVNLISRSVTCCCWCLKSSCSFFASNGSNCKILMVNCFRIGFRSEGLLGFLAHHSHSHSNFHIHLFPFRMESVFCFFYYSWLDSWS